jgi:hypothetical protein
VSCIGDDLGRGPWLRHQAVRLLRCQTGVFCEGVRFTLRRGFRASLAGSFGFWRGMDVRPIPSAEDVAENGRPRAMIQGTGTAPKVRPSIALGGALAVLNISRLLAPGRLVRPEQQFDRLSDGSDTPVAPAVPPYAPPGLARRPHREGRPLALLATKTLSPARQAGRGHRLPSKNEEQRGWSGESTAPPAKWQKMAGPGAADESVLAFIGVGHRFSSCSKRVKQCKRRERIERTGASQAMQNGLQNFDLSLCLSTMSVGRAVDGPPSCWRSARLAARSGGRLKSPAHR